VQARTLWSPPTGPLGRLTAQARTRAQALGSVRNWETRAANASPIESFREALLTGSVAVISEVKRRSPSKGSLDESIDAVTRARLYQDGGASAISVLTEPTEFGGSVDDLSAMQSVVTCPRLKKDFHVSPIQMFEARVYGASAALLIVRALGPDDTRVMADAARQAGVEPVFEVRDEAELSQALDAGAVVIGVNRRNLETLEMEPEVLARLLQIIPSRCVAIAESGITTRADVEEVAMLGADAVLVGSSLSVSPSPRAAVEALVGVVRGRRRD
jgi:indole-3-glycerol phosphate synthase